MLSRPQSSRQSCFRTPLWHDLHPDWLAIDARLGPQHPARLLGRLVARLDLQALHDSYAGRGSLAFPPTLLGGLLPCSADPRRNRSPLAQGLDTGNSRHD